MKVYLSARYGRMHELAAYAAQLAALGITCTSTWLTGSTFENSTENALTDVHDIYDADAFVTFSEEPVEFSDKSFASRGGRHVEFGVAYETGIPMLVVGPRENVFHLLDGVEQFDAWEAALERVQELAIDEAAGRILARLERPARPTRVRRGTR